MTSRLKAIGDGLAMIGYLVINVIVIPIILLFWMLVMIGDLLFSAFPYGQARFRYFTTSIIERQPPFSEVWARTKDYRRFNKLRKLDRLNALQIVKPNRLRAFRISLIRGWLADFERKQAVSQAA